jgi:SulP family sulfate permease
MESVPKHRKLVIIRMRRVSYMDQSGVYAMETAIQDLQAKGVNVLMTIIKPQPKRLLTKMNVIPNLVTEDHIFETFEDCTEYLKKLELR